MSDSRTRVHFFHADANAIGGRIERPFDKVVPVQSSLSLPTVGGYASARSKEFRFAGILSADAVETQVGGSYNGHNGSWTTIASAIVEGLNVLNVVTADRVVAQVSTEHPRDGYTPKVSFAGTQFVNLRISGKRVEPALDLGFCDQDDPEEYPKAPCISSSGFLARVADQQQRIRSGLAKAESRASRRLESWLQSRYPSPLVTGPNAVVNQGNMIVCSLVQEIQGDCAGQALGHILVIPEFGRVFLGELLLDHNSFNLIMLRFELGCPVQGDASAASTRINGSSYP